MTSLLVDHGWGGGAPKIGTCDQLVTSPEGKTRASNGLGSLSWQGRGGLACAGEAGEPPAFGLAV